MTSGPGTQKAKDALDMWLSGGGVIRLWTVAPAFDGTGGTESVPSGGAPTAAFNPAQDGTGGQIAVVQTSGSVTFISVPAASSSIVACSVHDPGDNSIVGIDRAWTAPGAGWSAGQSPNLAFVKLAFVPV